MTVDDYITPQEIAEIWGVTSRWIVMCCSAGRIEGAIKKGRFWLIPKDTEKPADMRYSSNKSEKRNCERYRG